MMYMAHLKWYFPYLECAYWVFLRDGADGAIGFALALALALALRWPMNQLKSMERTSKRKKNGFMGHLFCIGMRLLISVWDIAKPTPQGQSYRCVCKHPKVLGNILGRACGCRRFLNRKRLQDVRSSCAKNNTCIQTVQLLFYGHLWLGWKWAANAKRECRVNLNTCTRNDVKKVAWGGHITGWPSNKSFTESSDVHVYVWRTLKMQNNIQSHRWNTVTDVQVATHVSRFVW